MLIADINETDTIRDPKGASRAYKEFWKRLFFDIITFVRTTITKSIIEFINNIKFSKISLFTI